MSIPTEHQEQVAVVQWFRRQYPGVRIFAIPNGGHRSKVAAAKLKAEGVSSGVPDLYIPAWRLWVEMKRQRGGSLSQNQRDWIAYLDSIGHSVLVCKGFSDAEKKIAEAAKKALQSTATCI